MKNHTKIYLSAFGYDETDYICSELSGSPLKDIHHIHRRGSGGSAEADRIENLIGLNRIEHITYGDVTNRKAWLYTKHKEFMQNAGVKFDEKWINEQIEKYS